jgi:hypothetical protein
LHPDKGLPDSVLGSQISPDADLPPPSRKESLFARVQELKRAKADGRIEEIVRKLGLF